MARRWIARPAPRRVRDVGSGRHVRRFDEVSFSALKTIERIGAVSAAEFASSYELREEPVILEGAARDWRATRTWTPEYLKRLLGDLKVRTRLHLGGPPGFRRATPAEMFARGSSRFDAFLDAITRGPEAERSRKLFTGDEQFMVQRRDGRTTVNEALKPLLDDVEVPAVVPEDRLYTVWGWFSGRGVRTWLHYDNNGCHNANAQLVGTKRCWLFAPEELKRLHPFPLGGPNPAYNCSQIDVDALDLERFGDFREAVAWEGTLEPGDVLFIPALWFHTFVHEGELNANVNFWWKPQRPTMNPVAVRQALVDLAAEVRARGAVDGTTEPLLRALDDAATRRE